MNFSVGASRDPALTGHVCTAAASPLNSRADGAPGLDSTSASAMNSRITICALNFRMACVGSRERRERESARKHGGKFRGDARGSSETITVVGRPPADERCVGCTGERDRGWAGPGSRTVAVCAVFAAVEGRARRWGQEPGAPPDPGFPPATMATNREREVRGGVVEEGGAGGARHGVGGREGCGVARYGAGGREGCGGARR